jgi:hypothetical protein
MIEARATIALNIDYGDFGMWSVAASGEPMLAARVAVAETALPHRAHPWGANVYLRLRLTPSRQ